ncbi:MAG: Ig-like domain-containing protein, partial [Acidimicrobiia bacterium]
MTRSIRRLLLPFLCAALLVGGTLAQLAITADPAAAAAPISTMTLHPDDLTAVVGQNVTFSGSVTGTSGISPTGTLDFLDGVTPICSAVPLIVQTPTLSAANCATAALTLGTHSITATYSGDGALDPASSTTYVPAVAEVVGQASTTTVASAGTPEPGVVSQPLTFNAAVSVDAPGGGTPTGTVAFKTDGVNIVGCETRPLVAGAATCTTTGLTWGGQGITAVYSGDANNTTSGSTEFLFTVEAAGTTTAVTSSDLTTSWTDPVTYTATISPVSPATLAPGTGTVSFNIGGTPADEIRCRMVDFRRGSRTMAEQPLRPAMLGALLLLAAFSAAWADDL